MANDSLDKIIQWLVRFRIPFFFGTVVLLFAITLLFPLPKFNGSLNGFNLENDEFISTAKEVEKVFGGQNNIYLLVKPSTNDRKKVFAETVALENKLKSEMTRVTCLSPCTFYRKLQNEFRVDGNDLQKFLDHASRIPALQNLVGKDHQSFLIVLSIEREAKPELRLLDSIIKSDFESIESISPMSFFHMQQTMEDYIQHDLAIISLGILILFLIFFIWVFRSFKPVFFTGLLVSVSLLMSIFFFSLFGFSITVVSVLVFPVTLILSLSDCLHLLGGYAKSPESDQERRISLLLRKIIFPSFYSSLTTAVSFFSFYFFNDSAFIRELGLVTGCSLLTEFILTFLMTPYLLFHLKGLKVRDYSMNHVSGWLLKHSKKFALIFIGLLIVAPFFVSQLHFKSDFSVFFPTGSEIEKTHNEFDKNFYSPADMNILISPNNAAKLVDSVYREEVKSWVEKLKKKKDIIALASATDTYLVKTSSGFSQDIYQVFGEKNPYYREEDNLFRIELKFKNHDALLVFEKNELRSLVRDSELNIRYTAVPLVMNHINKSVAESLLWSFSTTGITIFLMMLLITHSIRMAFLSLLPNLVPIAVLILIFSIFGIPVNILTAITAVISIGLLDDDTIHILYRRLWLNEPIDELNFSIFSSAFLLVAGFSLFLISSFKPTVEFGGFTALVFITGVLAEMTLMQRILMFIKRK